MRDWLYHVPYGLALFLVLFLGVTVWAWGVESKVLMTFLAPLLWLGLYWLGARHAMRQDP